MRHPDLATRAPADRVLDVQDLHVSVGMAGRQVDLVRGVSFHLDRGETLGLVGESGCGKSLTSLAVMRLQGPRLRPHAERMRFRDTDLTRPEGRGQAVRGRRMAMIFQDPMTSLNPTMTIGAQMIEGYVHHEKASPAQARKKALYLLDRVGIPLPEQRMNSYPHQLSGGQRQRVMIASALMTDPELLIADEPTTALDVTVQVQILHLLDEIRREVGFALLLITHDLGLVARVADRVAVMYSGRIVETGPTAQIFGQPMHPYTRGLIQAVPYPGRVAGTGRLATIPGTVPDPATLGDGCAFHDRCDLARPACLQGMPPIRAASGSHRYECIHPAPKGAPA